MIAAGYPCGEARAANCHDEIAHSAERKNRAVQQKRFRQIALSLAVMLLATVVIGVLTLAHGVTRRSAEVPSRLQATPTALPSATPTYDPWASEALSVSGTRILDAYGRPVTLLGAARFSLEYACHGDVHFNLADFLAMRLWGMNTVRIPLSSAFWRNLDNRCPDYRATVTSAVTNAEAAGLYVMLDLQREAPFSQSQDATDGGAQCPLPDGAYDLKFWKDLAEMYRNDPRVLFDLFGEPYNVDWHQWWNGGPITSDCFAYATPLTYSAIGMPTLAAAVRAIAPRNVIVVSGIAWGYDLSGIGTNSRIPMNNLLYATHPWNHQSVQQPGDWPRAFGATAKQVAVIATEFGAYDCQTGYISAEIAYFVQLHMSFLAWAWTPGGCPVPSLIANWDGTPTTPYGQYIRQQMRLAAAHNPTPPGVHAPKFS